MTFAAPPVSHATVLDLSAAMQAHLHDCIAQAGGWLPFDGYMHQALYAPGLGYYARGDQVFGRLARDGSDFVTAPELSPYFGRAVAVQVAAWLREGGPAQVWEFGAGSGALAEQVLTELRAQGLADGLTYHIVEVSAALAQQQQARLAAWGHVVQWVQTLPDTLGGVVLGNEVLDAMPVKLLARIGGVWHERGVVWHQGGLAFADVPTQLRPPLDVEAAHDYVTEIHPQADAFIATVAERLRDGVALFIDYGFTESEYYHPQRHMGTLVTHGRHRVGHDLLAQPGQLDITAHLNFTGLALAAQDAGAQVLGYTTQARFLLNCGLLSFLEQATPVSRAQGQKLITEHEMGELFKVLAFADRATRDVRGWSVGDRTHTL
jgi:SAM-dependent MidA family methyltransferase